MREIRSVRDEHFILQRVSRTRYYIVVHVRTRNENAVKGAEHVHGRRSSYAEDVVFREDNAVGRMDKSPAVNISFLPTVSNRFVCVRSVITA